MNNITIITLFPQMFDNFLDNSTVKKAIANHKIQIKLVNLFDYKKKNKRIDSKPISGGPGLIIKCKPILEAINDYCQNSYKILLSPKGKVFDENKAKQLSKKKDITIICGHYEGVDERVNNYVDELISIGDFIVTNAELIAMVIIDSVIRLVKNVISEKSLLNESFDNYLLEYPQYTKPYNFNGYKVPEILYSGNHQIIKKYNHEEQLRITQNNRPDLLKKAQLTKEDKIFLAKLKNKKNGGVEEI